MAPSSSFRACHEPAKNQGSQWAESEQGSPFPESQRKSVFSVRFFVVNVPYHNVYLSNAAEATLKEDLEGEGLWLSKDLAIPVFRTDTGSSFSPFERMRVANSVRFLRRRFSGPSILPYTRALRCEVPVGLVESAP